MLSRPGILNFILVHTCTRQVTSLVSSISFQRRRDPDPGPSTWLDELAREQAGDRLQETGDTHTETTGPRGRHKLVAGRVLVAILLVENQHVGMSTNPFSAALFGRPFGALIL